MGWRFINPKLKAMYGVDTMPQTAENVAQQFNIDRADQDQFALTSQQRTATAQAQGFFTHEIIPVILHSVRVIQLWSTRMNIHVHRPP
jgi:acetyl-CoA acetyltransferase